MNPTRNPSALRSKKEITEALLNLMKQYRFSDITVKQILYESQVSRKTFYRNFSSKNDVLTSYIRQLIHEYADRLSSFSKSSDNAQFSPDGILKIIFEMCLDNREILLYLYDNELMYLLLQQINSEIPTIHTQIVPENHYLFADISPQYIEYIIDFNVGAVWNIIYTWIRRGMTDDPQLMISEINTFLNKLVSE